MSGRRASPPRHAVGLLDESDAHVLGERRLGRRDEIAGGHAAGCAVASTSQPARLLELPQLDAGRAVRSVDVEHHRGVCPQHAGRPMSFDPTPRQ